MKTTSSLILFLLALPVQAATLHVSKTGDASDGLSWETGFRTVSDAIEAATSGDRIWVAGGVYYGSHQLRDGVDLYGGFSGQERPEEFHPRDWEANPTILSGQGSDESILLGADDVTIDGFIVEDGRASVGAGLRCNGVEMRIRNTRFQNNLCQGRARQSLGYNVVSSCRGGAISCSQSKLEIDNCSFDSNRCSTILNGSSSSGPADGYAYAEGGAIWIGPNSLLVCKNSKFRGNSCHASARFIVNGIGTYTMDNGHATAKGGAIDFGFGSEIDLTNCLLINNSVGGGGSRSTSIQGSAVNSRDGEIEMIHCTTSGNQGPANSDAIRIDRGSIHNSIVWDGPVSIATNPNFESRVTYSNIQSGFEGEGNVSVDPLFVSPGTGNYRLQESSPCIDAASEDGVSLDLDGHVRPVDIPGVGRDGDGNEFDMGAYEAGSTPPPNLLFDETSDGLVNSADLLKLLGFESEKEPPGGTTDFFHFSIYWMERETSFR